MDYVQTNHGGYNYIRSLNVTVPSDTKLCWACSVSCSGMGRLFSYIYTAYAVYVETRKENSWRIK